MNEVFEIKGPRAGINQTNQYSVFMARVMGLLAMQSFEGLAMIAMHRSWRRQSSTTPTANRNGPGRPHTSFRSPATTSLSCRRKPPGAWSCSGGLRATFSRETS